VRPGYSRADAACGALVAWTDRRGGVLGRSIRELRWERRCDARVAASRRTTWRAFPSSVVRLSLLPYTRVKVLYESVVKCCQV
jgi:hypothetical protein